MIKLHLNHNQLLCQSIWFQNLFSTSLCIYCKWTLFNTTELGHFIFSLNFSQPCGVHWGWPTDKIWSPLRSSPLRSAGAPARMKDTNIPSPFSPPTMLKPRPVDPFFRIIFLGSLKYKEKQFIWFFHQNKYQQNVMLLCALDLFWGFFLNLLTLHDFLSRETTCVLWYNTSLQWGNRFRRSRITLTTQTFLTGASCGEMNENKTTAVQL